MTNVTMSVKHFSTQTNQPCAVCRAVFIPAEDSGSRVFSLNASPQAAFEALMCGGCFSKWSHGATVTLRHELAR